MSEQVRLLSYEQLRERGIVYHKRSLWRLERKGKFPKRVIGTGGRCGGASWVESEIDQFLKGRVAARDEEMA